LVPSPDIVSKNTDSEDAQTVVDVAAGAV
jgi:hypothetical protein